MKTMELENYGLVELDSTELREINGGDLPHPFDEILNWMLFLLNYYAE